MEGRCRQTVGPLSYVTEVTAGLGNRGRLLLFMDRNEEANNADDNQCVLKQFTVCHHRSAPLS